MTYSCTPGNHRERTQDTGHRTQAPGKLDAAFMANPKRFKHVALHTKFMTTGVAKSLTRSGPWAKDEAIREWCERIAEATGTAWRYVRVDQADFGVRKPASVADLTIPPS